MPSARGVSENVIAGLIAAPILAGIGFAISRVDAPIALWVVFVVFVLAVAIGIGVGQAMRYGDDRLRYQSKHLGDAMLALRQGVAGKLNVSFDKFIERGVLEPAIYGLSRKRREEIRLSVLVLDEHGEFRMLYEAGHALGRKDGFSLPRASLAGHALDSGKLQWTNNVEEDKRWHALPSASEGRGFQSSACMPIVVGDDCVAVLSVVSSAKGAFLKSDLTHVELLGGFIGLAWALNESAGSSYTLSSSQELNASDRKGA